ncbi:restriction endonuclease subunit R [Mesoplasma entomophilum]|uniref:Uncharacterized protein n=1 Tax=Mesoplasma entomophilum TaxID=2149 RepID=A0A3S5XZJ0_9MOLU|nr:hypothetical protein [Mesoplasma entomophilum]ATQ35456.1 hypothetical protein CS528_01595 [Mesoplasma entomophilum]ATZ19416.1 restriction endonuclease subunit R [Mesoplasma entomophilum]
MLRLSNNYKDVKNFLEYRISSKDYRGMHLFQHNRITTDKIKAIYDSYKKINKEFIEIPRGDEYNKKNKPNGFKLHEFPEYELFVKLINEAISQGSAMAIKKNLLVDLARLEVIDRFDQNKNKLNPYKKCVAHYFKINSDFFLKYDNSDISLEILLKKKIELSLSNLLKCIFDLISNPNLNYMTFDEFFLFVTWFDFDYKGKKIDNNYLVNLIIEYRKIAKSEKNILFEDLKKIGTPDKNVKKIYKKDYNNWKNEAQEIFSILKGFALFQFNNKLNSIEFNFKKIDRNQIKFARSMSTKENYFNEHNIKKQIGFELDHVIPFSLISNYNEYIEIDNWRNLVYIDANTHRIKTSLQNKYMFLSKKNEKLNMYAADGDNLELINGNNLLINDELIEGTIQYNKYLSKKYNI